MTTVERIADRPKLIITRTLLLKVDAGSGIGKSGMQKFRPGWRKRPMGNRIGDGGALALTPASVSSGRGVNGFGIVSKTSRGTDLIKAYGDENFMSNENFINVADLFDERKPLAAG